MTSPHPVALDDKYTLAHGRAYMSGVHALVRLPLMQKARDAAAAAEKHHRCARQGKEGGCR